jgi:hypothetical protein
MPELVTIHRTTDALEAEILADLLVEHGIEARVRGARVGSAPLVLASEMEARVAVPVAEVEAARRIVDEHLDAARVPVEEETEPEPQLLRHVLAAGVVMICPGGARRSSACW